MDSLIRSNHADKKHPKTKTAPNGYKKRYFKFKGIFFLFVIERRNDKETKIEMIYIQINTVVSVSFIPLNSVNLGS